MLSMALFKSLVKQHGKQFFEPIGQILQQRGIARPNLANPTHFWALREPLLAYARWYAEQRLMPSRWSEVPGLAGPLARHVTFAQSQLSQARVAISDLMRTHQLKLADRQCRMSEISAQVQDAVTILVTSLHAQRSEDPIVREAADTICRELTRRMTGSLPSDSDFRQVTQLGQQIAETPWSELSGIQAAPLMMPYDQSVAIQGYSRLNSNTFG
jgi:hypothetical protein